MKKKLRPGMTDELYERLALTLSALAHKLDTYLKDHNTDYLNILERNNRYYPVSAHQLRTWAENARHKDGYIMWNEVMHLANELNKKLANY